jgi:hypothetical protein
MHHPSEADRLFPSPVLLVHVHLQWTPGDGWTVRVSHRHEGQQAEQACHPDDYCRLSYSEAWSTVDSQVGRLLPWLELGQELSGTDAAAS